MSATIVGLGYCGWDILSVLPRIPIDDKVKIIESMEQGGGPSATAIYAAAKLGSDCAFAGAVGDDAQGDKIIEAFRGVGVDTSAIVRRRGAASPTAYCWIEQTTGHRSIAWTSGAVTPLSPDELDYDLIASAAILHLDGHQTDAAIAAARFARDHGVTVSIDAGTVVPRIDELLALCDIVIMSEKFARAHAGAEDDPAQGARRLFRPGVTRFCGVTLGSRGSVGFDGERDYFQRTFPVKVVDTTGAGDTYHGSFCNALSRGLSWQDCMRQASMTSALKCTRLGGRTGLPTMEQLRQALDENPDD